MAEDTGVLETLQAGIRLDPQLVKKTWGTEDPFFVKGLVDILFEVVTTKEPKKVRIALQLLEGIWKDNLPKPAIDGLYIFTIDKKFRQQLLNEIHAFLKSCKGHPVGEFRSTCTAICERIETAAQHNNVELSDPSVSDLARRERTFAFATHLPHEFFDDVFKAIYPLRNGLHRHWGTFAKDEELLKQRECYVELRGKE